jgi:hypothetical protein
LGVFGIGFLLITFLELFIFVFEFIDIIFILLGLILDEELSLDEFDLDDLVKIMLFFEQLFTE